MLNSCNTQERERARDPSHLPHAASPNCVSSLGLYHFPKVFYLFFFLSHLSFLPMSCSRRGRLCSGHVLDRCPSSISASPSPPLYCAVLPAFSLITSSERLAGLSRRLWENPSSIMMSIGEIASEQSPIGPHNS